MGSVQVELPLVYQRHPAIEVFMREVLDDETYDKLKRKQRKRIKTHLLKSLFHLHTARSYRASLTEILDQDKLDREFLDLRRKLTTHHAMNAAYKIAVIDEVQGDDDAFERLGFSEATKEELDEYLAPKGRDKLQELVRKLPIKQPNVPAMDKMITDTLVQLKPFLVRFAYVKLRFIANSHRFDLNDIISELEAKVIETVRWLYPFKTPEHIVNSCKQSVHNYGLNLLYFWNNQRRGRMTREEDGSFNNRHLLMIEDKITAETECKYAESEESIAYSQMLDRFKGRERVVVRLLALDESQKPFLKWANYYLDQEYDSIEVLFTRNEKQYKQLICIYLDLSKDRLSEIEQEIASVLRERQDA